MYGPVVCAAAVLVGIAALVLYLNDLYCARSKHWLRDVQQRRAIDRIFEEGRRRRGR
jgi:hypothetical protein